MSTQIRNFYFANKDAPILWILTKSQFLVITIFSLLPWFWFFINIQSWANFSITIISLIITFVCAWIWFWITSAKVDWRTIVNYMLDSRREKISRSSKRFSIKQKDINALIDQIKI